MREKTAEIFSDEEAAESTVLYVTFTAAWSNREEVSKAGDFTSRPRNHDEAECVITAELLLLLLVVSMRERQCEPQSQ